MIKSRIVAFGGVGFGSRSIASNGFMGSIKKAFKAILSFKMMIHNALWFQI